MILYGVREGSDKTERWESEKGGTSIREAVNHTVTRAPAPQTCETSSHEAHTVLTGLC